MSRWAPAPALLGLCLAGLLTGCRGTPPPLPPVPASSGSILLPPARPPVVPDDQSVVDRVVAVVNQEVILMSELQEAVILYLRDTRGAPPPAGELGELQRKVLHRMLDHRLQVQEARREGVGVSEDEVRGAVEDFVKRNGGDRARVESQLRGQGLTWDAVRRELRDQLLVQKIRGRRVGRHARVTEAEVEAYLAANRAKLEVDLKYRPRHIAILVRAGSDPAAWERAREEIEGIRLQLENGADFGELARTRSQDGSAAAAGDLGWLARGELQPLFETPILALELGQVTSPIKSAAGYHLFKLEERENLTPEMVAAFRQQARELLLQQKAQERFDEWLEELRRRALISIRL